MRPNKLSKYQDSDSSVTSQNREVGGDRQEKTNSEISFCLTSNYEIETNPFLGGNEEKNNAIIGVNMDEELQRFHDYLCREYTNKTTIKNIFNAVKRFCKDVGGVLSKENIQIWRRSINETKERNTINVYVSSVNIFLSWKDKTYNKQSPDWMKTPGTEDTDKETLTEQEIKTLIKNSEKDLETHLILLLLFHALRPNEIINIKISKLEDDILYLKDTKTGNNHTILTKQIQNAWKKYLKIRPKPKQGYEDYLLICDHSEWKGKPYVTTLPIQKKIKRLAKNNGIEKDVTPYMIRRTSATLRLSNDSEFCLGNPKNVQRLFRHKNIETTLRYDHTTDDDLRKSLQECEKDLNEDGKNLIENGKDLIKIKRTYPLNSF